MGAGVEFRGISMSIVSCSLVLTGGSPELVLNMDGDGGVTAGAGVSSVLSS